MNNRRKSIFADTYTVDISKNKIPHPCFPPVQLSPSLPHCYKEITPEDFIIKQDGAEGMVKRGAETPAWLQV
jgi:hypothetical protein